MEIQILEEAGYQWALCGTSLSFKDEGIPFTSWWTKDKLQNMSSTCTSMAFKDGGHNKFLESIQLWLYIKAPRGWWQEFDTYRVGTTKNSSSTMHTIQKRPLTIDDFEFGTDDRIINVFNDILVEATNNFTNTMRLKGEALQKVKWNIPEGFLQSRIVNLNYKVLRHIFLQRWSHNLHQWQTFISFILANCEHPELLPRKDKK
jgi:hypothetical protein